MISQNFLFLLPFIHGWGQISYVLTTLKGKSQPNRVSFLLWAVIAFIVFAGQINEGVGWPAALTFIAAFGPLMIFIVSFVDKRAYWKISKLDIFCGILSVLAIVVWVGTGSAIYAIALGVLADFLASLPTVVKSFNFPETENFVIFRNAMIGGIITLLTIDNWTFSVYAFAAYMVLINLVLVILIKYRMGLKLKTIYVRN